MIAAKIELSHWTNLIDDSFIERINKENWALLLFNNEIESTVKDLIYFMMKEVYI